MRNQEPPGTRLEGWKAIARYLGKDPRTALRWVELGLPVFRVNGRNSSVYAYSDELEAWLRRRFVACTTAAPGSPPAAPAAAPRAEPGTRRASGLDPAPAALAPARPGEDLARLPREADEMLRLARRVVGRELEPNTDPLVLAHALAAAWRSFLEELRAALPSADTSAPRSPSRTSRVPLSGLGTRPTRPAAASRPRTPLG